MALTDTRIRKARPHAKAYKLSDGGGMYLLVTPHDARYWRLDYRFCWKASHPCSWRLSDSDTFLCPNTSRRSAGFAEPGH